jgi:hypothetical protein
MFIPERTDGKKNYGKVVFRDSINLIPGPLADMVETFDLDVQDKPFFPHLCTKESNYGKDIYPTKDDYLADGMKKEKREKFEAWFEENKDKPFRLENQLASYCVNDTGQFPYQQGLPE